MVQAGRVPPPPLTVTVTLAVVLPPVPVQVRVYLVVVFKAPVEAEPLVDLLPLKRQPKICLHLRQFLS